jgi:hypothetical protein
MGLLAQPANTAATATAAHAADLPNATFLVAVGALFCWASGVFFIKYCLELM